VFGSAASESTMAMPVKANAASAHLANGMAGEAIIFIS
jgi:hypothetical protein